MNFKKSNGKTFGMNLTSKEHQAMVKEIQRQLAEMNEKNANELCAMVLYVLHTEFGFGKKRLRKFYDQFGEEVNALAKRYMMDKDEMDKRPWLCTFMLKREGIDIEEWEREKNDGTNNQ